MRRDFVVVRSLSFFFTSVFFVVVAVVVRLLICRFFFYLSIICGLWIAVSNNSMPHFFVNGTPMLNKLNRKTF